MFFRKDIFNAKPASLEAEIDHETTEEDDVKSLPSDTRPVYIIGDNALTCYLAAKITDAGHNVIVIAGKGNNVSLSTNGISLKEDSSLKLSRYKFTTSFWIKEEPKLVIITADAGHINSSLAAVSKTKIGGAPVLCFTPLKDINYLEAVVGGNLFRAFFDGYLQMENQQVFLYGRAPQIKICKNINWEKENPFPELFSYTGLNISYETDTSLCYWEFFAPYAVGSLLAALNNKNLFDITKDKQLRDQIPLLIAETAEIAAMLREIGSPLSPVEIDSFILDNCYARELEFEDFFARAFGREKLHFVDEGQQAVFYNYIEDRFEELTGNYNRVDDELKAPLRSTIMELVGDRLEFFDFLESAGEKLDQLPEEKVHRLAEVSMQLVEILKMLNDPRFTPDETELDRLTETVEQRADDHYGTSERRTLADKISAFDIRRVYIVGPERIPAFLMPGHLHAHTLKKKYKIADIKDFRHIGNRDFLRSQQYGTYHFQCLVLGSLRPDHTAQLMSAFDYKCAHVQIFIYVRLPE